MKSHVLIVGAGAVGCLSALVLAKRGWQVTLVDAGAVGGESSWAGGGILFPLLPWKYVEQVNSLALAGAAGYPALCRELLDATGIDPQYQACGMMVFSDFGGEAALQWCQRHGVAVEMRQDALWLPQVGQVRNPRLMQALKARLLEMGVCIREHTRLQPLQADCGRVATWRSNGGELFEAEAFVLTAGAWSRDLLGMHAMSIRHKPMRGQMLLYRLAEGVLPHILYRDDFYLIPRRDGHILAGSTVEDAGFDKSTTADAVTELAAKAHALLPQLEHAPLVKHWSGLRPGSPDNLPVIARHPQLDNLYISTGHYRYGVTMAPASAEILAQLVCGEALADGADAYAFPLNNGQPLSNH
jgi:glycine oxidase